MTCIQLRTQLKHMLNSLLYASGSHDVGTSRSCMTSHFTVINCLWLCQWMTQNVSCCSYKPLCCQIATSKTWALKHIHAAVKLRPLLSISTLSFPRLSHAQHPHAWLIRTHSRTQALVFQGFRRATLPETRVNILCSDSRRERLRLFPYHLTTSDKLTLVGRLAAEWRSNRYGAVSIRLQRNATFTSQH